MENNPSKNKNQSEQIEDIKKLKEESSYRKKDLKYSELFLKLKLKNEKEANKEQKEFLEPELENQEESLKNEKEANELAKQKIIEDRKNKLKKSLKEGVKFTAKAFMETSSMGRMLLALDNMTGISQTTVDTIKDLKKASDKDKEAKKEEDADVKETSEVLSETSNGLSETNKILEEGKKSASKETEKTQKVEVVNFDDTLKQNKDLEKDDERLKDSATGIKENEKSASKETDKIQKVEVVNFDEAEKRNKDLEKEKIIEDRKKEANFIESSNEIKDAIEKLSEKDSNIVVESPKEDSGFFSSFLGMFSKFFKRIGGKLIGILASSILKSGGLLKVIAGSVTSLVTKGMGPILGVLGKGVKFLGPVGAILGIGGGIFQGLEKANELFGENATLGEKTSAALGGVVNSLTFGLIDIETSAKWFASIGDDIKAIWNDLPNMFSDIGNWIKETFSFSGDWITEKLDNLLNWYLEKVKSFFNGILGLFGTSVDELKNSILNSVSNIGSWVIDKLSGVVDSYFNILGKIFDPLLNLFGTSVDELKNSISGAINSVLDWVKDLIPDMSGVKSFFGFGDDEKEVQKKELQKKEVQKKEVQKKELTKIEKIKQEKEDKKKLREQQERINKIPEEKRSKEISIIKKERIKIESNRPIIKDQANTQEVAKAQVTTNMKKEKLRKEELMMQQAQQSQNREPIIVKQKEKGIGVKHIDKVQDSDLLLMSGTFLSK